MHGKGQHAVLKRFGRGLIIAHLIIRCAMASYLVHFYGCNLAKCHE